MAPWEEDAPPAPTGIAVARLLLHRPSVPAALIAGDKMHPFRSHTHLRAHMAAKLLQRQASHPPTAASPTPPDASAPPHAPPFLPATHPLNLSGLSSPRGAPATTSTVDIIPVDPPAAEQLRRAGHRAGGLSQALSCSSTAPNRKKAGAVSGGAAGGESIRDDHTRPPPPPPAVTLTAAQLRSGAVQLPLPAWAEGMDDQGFVAPARPPACSPGAAAAPPPAGRSTQEAASAATDGGGDDDSKVLRWLMGGAGAASAQEVPLTPHHLQPTLLQDEQAAQATVPPDAVPPAAAAALAPGQASAALWCARRRRPPPPPPSLPEAQGGAGSFDASHLGSPLTERQLLYTMAAHGCAAMPPTPAPTPREPGPEVANPFGSCRDGGGDDGDDGGGPGRMSAQSLLGRDLDGLVAAVRPLRHAASAGAGGGGGGGGRPRRRSGSRAPRRRRDESATAAALAALRGGGGGGADLPTSSPLPTTRRALRARRGSSGSGAGSPLDGAGCGDRRSANAAAAGTAGPRSWVASVFRAIDSALSAVVGDDITSAPRGPLVRPGALQQRPRELQQQEQQQQRQGPPGRSASAVVSAGDATALLAALHGGGGFGLNPKSRRLWFSMSLPSGRTAAVAQEGLAGGGAAGGEGPGSGGGGDASVVPDGGLAVCTLPAGEEAGRPAAAAAAAEAGGSTAVEAAVGGSGGVALLRRVQSSRDARTAWWGVQGSFADGQPSRS